MILPNEQWSNAVMLGKQWLDDPKTKIMYAGTNGVVLRRDDTELSIRLKPRQIAFEVLK